jgi:hypothetical protein
MMDPSGEQPPAATPLLSAANAGSSSPYACFTSIVVQGKAYPYEYHRFALEFPQGIVAASHGSTMMYRHRVVDTEGRILRLANCAIPRNTGAFEMMNQRFEVPPELRKPKWRSRNGQEFTIEGCVSDGHCELDAIVVVAPSSPSNCETAGCPGYTGGSTTSGTSGGSSSCESCDPSTPVLKCTSPVQRGATVDCSVTSGTRALPRPGVGCFKEEADKFHHPVGRSIGPDSGGGRRRFRYSAGYGWQCDGSNRQLRRYEPRVALGTAQMELHPRCCSYV